MIWLCLMIASLSQRIHGIRNVLPRASNKKAQGLLR
jgi:hypothetical protein